VTAIIIPIKGEMKKDARINGEESVSKPIAAIPEAAHTAPCQRCCLESSEHKSTCSYAQNMIEIQVRAAHDVVVDLEGRHSGRCRRAT